MRLHPISGADSGPLDLTSLTTGSPLVYDVSGFSLVTVQGVVRGTTAWTTGAIEILRSNNGTTGVALETAQSLTGTASMSAVIDVNFGCLHLACSAVESGVLVELYVWGVPDQ